MILPIKDKLKLVSSNYAVILKDLDRVVKSLKKKDALPDYFTVFHEQGKQGIVERNSVFLKNYGKYI